jgi:hypothetical protein
MESLSAAEAEAIEAEFMFAYEAGAPARDQELLGIATRRICGGVALSARTDPSHYWSKALGFGFDDPVSADLIDQVIDVYRAEENPLAVLQIAPEVLPDDWDWIRRTRGLSQGGRIAKFAAPIESLTPPGSGDLRTAPVTTDHAAVAPSSSTATWTNSRRWATGRRASPRGRRCCATAGSTGAARPTTDTRDTRPSRRSPRAARTPARYCCWRPARSPAAPTSMPT